MSILKQLRAILQGLLLVIVTATSRFLCTIGLNVQAISLLRMAIQWFPKSASMLHSQLASAYEGIGQLDQAVACLTDAIRSGPNSEFYCWELAIMYEKHGQPELALVNFQRSLDLDSGFSEGFRSEIQSKIEQLRLFVRESDS